MKRTRKNKKNKKVMTMMMKKTRRGREKEDLRKSNRQCYLLECLRRDELPIFWKHLECVVKDQKFTIKE